MTVKFANNATSRIASSISSSDTTISVLTGEGGRFPAATSGDTFPITLVKANGQVEICRCTARSSDVLTVTRAQEGTTALSFTAGDRVELRMTDGAFEERLGEKFDKTGGAISGNTSVGGDLSVTGNTSVGGSDSVLPVYSSPPLTDVGPIYIIGQGDAEWDGSESKYKPAQIPYDNVSSGLTATTLQGAIDEVAGSSDFTIIYPNGGTEASPANVSINTRYVETNPFPGYYVICEAQVYIAGKWGATGWYTDALGGVSHAYGVSAHIFDGNVVIQVAKDGIHAGANTCGSPNGAINPTTAATPCRVLVWKVKGAI